MRNKYRYTVEQVKAMMDNSSYNSTHLKQYLKTI